LARVRPRHAPEANVAKVQRLLGVLRPLPFGATQAGHAADIRAVLERQGQGIGPVDVLIAATARAGGMTLLMSHVRDFGRVGGLAVEDWVG